ncbi:Nucleotide-binding universal stress protein, UspA family [Geodermatophilus pulveris]|uniref:Nucleotide-binding universal stress protein, UspA family n=1 Tax=Geodermatophilus pulveris TaxID=1564159 RepID=A0A239GHV1_9ACTN|nr:universal stress protein [Geodermatophilus pulveris]SNS68465.1 Nucleotide-binding universal stress protein, UspA family [Geodermatophilus pulveris]
MSTTTPTPAGTTPAPRAPGDGPPPPPVVVGADGSECGLRAVRWAAEDAARRGAPLRIVHATPHLGHRGVAGSPAAWLPRARGATAQAYTVAVHTAPSVPVSTEVVPGDPAAALLRAAEDAQLVVLGIATTGVADELVLASVAQRVAARSPRPVVVVPRSRPGGTGSRPDVAVLGLGEREDDEPVVAFAAEAALRTRTPLLVLHTRPDDGGAWAADSPQWDERWPDLRVTHAPVPSPTGGRVLAAACPTPLLVMTAGHGGLLHRPLDGLHRWLLRHCTSPMVFVPPVHRRSSTEPREEIIAVG